MKIIGVYWLENGNHKIAVRVHYPGFDPRWSMRTYGGVVEDTHLRLVSAVNIIHVLKRTTGT